MGALLTQWIGCFGGMILLTLGVPTVWGLLVHACAVAFRRLTGRGAGTVFDVTAVLGTPVHELGHAAMCLLFGHKITRMKLWSPRVKGGLYGYVEHSYHRKNLWARMGNLFIGMGPLFSGLGVVVLTLWLCFPTAWDSYLATTGAVLSTEAELGELLRCVSVLPRDLLLSFGTDPLRSIFGTAVMLSVALHISMSWQDVKGSLRALPVYLLFLGILAAVFLGIGAKETVFWGLRLWNLRLLSLFSVVAALSFFWVLVGCVVRLFSALLHLGGRK
jgi:hypothetical protein